MKKNTVWLPKTKKRPAVAAATADGVAVSGGAAAPARKGLPFPFRKWDENDKYRMSRIMLGTRERNGFLKGFVFYALLICIGFIYIYPILYMLSKSLMPLEDLLDVAINWLPSSPTLGNYAQAGRSMNFWHALWQSVVIAGAPTVFNVISCSFIGYGLARFNFPGRRVLIGIIIFSFILPSQVTMIPTYVLYSNLNILGTIWAFILPSMFGMGINAPIFILIFYQFFRHVPKVLIEAAQIDGAGYLQAYLRISLPSAWPAILTVFLFSFVWYWNEAYLTQMYVSGVMTDTGWTSLVIQLDKFAQNFDTFANTSGSYATSLNESISMAGTMLSILPVLIMYFVLQRYFVESIDRVGITGE